ncbi:MAG: cytochrome c-type biogenesis protein [Hyphomicrobiales bacterium]
MRRLLSAVLLVLLVAVPALAVQPDEVLNDPALEGRARALSAGLRCLVCQNQSIDDSEAPLARDLRLLIRERLVKGDTDDQVVNFIVDRYGEYVLLKPRFEARTILLWAGPFVLVLLAGLYLWATARRPSADREAPLTPEEQATLERLQR